MLAQALARRVSLINDKKFRQWWERPKHRCKQQQQKIKAHWHTHSVVVAQNPELNARKLRQRRLSSSRILDLHQVWNTNLARAQTGANSSSRCLYLQWKKTDNSKLMNAANRTWAATDFFPDTPSLLWHSHHNSAAPTGHHNLIGNKPHCRFHAKQKHRNNFLHTCTSSFPEHINVICSSSIDPLETLKSVCRNLAACTYILAVKRWQTNNSKWMPQTCASTGISLLSICLSVTPPTFSSS